MQNLPYIINKLNEQLVYLLVFHAYINEMHGSRSKIPSKNLVKQRCAEGFNSGVKGLTVIFPILNLWESEHIVLVREILTFWSGVGKLFNLSRRKCVVRMGCWNR